jgi:glycosyltransferase involved in cell wall biosynthesis
MQLSIIIPVYNVAAYIEKCVVSLQNQDIENTEYEIVIINDGSPDNSKEVVLGLMKQYSNIVFIDQENKGVSLARNAGIDKAKGKYLLFIDPDDYVEVNSFKRVLAAANQHAANVAFLGYTFFDANGVVKKEMFFTEFKNNVYKGVEAYFNARVANTLDPDRTWAVLFERAFFNNNNIRYIANVPYLEDGELIARVCCLADRCIFEGSSFYLRTTRQGSATNSKLFYADKSINGFIKAAENLKQFSLNPTLSATQLKFINHPIAKFVLLTIEASAKISSIQKVFSTHKKLKECNVGTLSIEGVKKPYSTLVKLYNISPIVYVIYLWATRMNKSINIKIKKILKLT